MIDEVDAVVIGGGFYGSVIAGYLAGSRSLSVLLIEKETALLTRASYNNQARVHNGYHYPRSFTTAYRSRVNLPRFIRDWPDAVKTDFRKVYAIARRNSKVTSRQFERFCRDIGAQIAPSPPPIKALFNESLIESVYDVVEYAFDASVLAEQLREQLHRSGVSILWNTEVHTVHRTGDRLTLQMTAEGKQGEIRSRYVFNCTYSGLNRIDGDYSGTKAGLKHEITEMALVDLPAPFREMGITVMDGSFFSLMPFPARSLHTMSHVRYTPHMHWHDDPDVDPYAVFDQYTKQSRFDWMYRDICRYMPGIQAAVYVDSLFEVKTVLVKNEGDDGRPILIEKYPELPGFFSVLGGKIDNIYDVMEKLDAEAF